MTGINKKEDYDTGIRGNALSDTASYDPLYKLLLK